MLLPILLLVAALTVARPALESRWADWRAERPWVDQLLGVVSAAREMLGDGEREPADTAAAPEPSGARRTGVNDRGAMPPDLPVWPRALSETFSAGDQHAAGHQRVPEARDAVVRWFRRTMPARGWKLERERSAAGGVLLLYRKDDRIARVELVADSGATDIWIRSRRVEPRP